MTRRPTRHNFTARLTHHAASGVVLLHDIYQGRNRWRNHTYIQPADAAPLRDIPAGMHIRFTAIEGTYTRRNGRRGTNLTQLGNVQQLTRGDGYRLTMPPVLFEELSSVAREEDTSITALLQTYIKLGLLVTTVRREGGSLILRDGDTEQEITL